MKVNTVLAAKAFGGPTPTSQKDDQRSFGGVLSTVADDAAGQVAASKDKLKTPDAEIPDAKTADPQTSESKMSDLMSWPAAAPIVSLGRQGPSARSREATATFGDPNEKADAVAADKAETKADQAAPALPDASLLALVQIAAFTQPQNKIAETSARATATAVADANIGAIRSAPADPSSLLVKAAADPLVSGVALESHLAPVGAVGDAGSLTASQSADLYGVAAGISGQGPTPDASGSGSQSGQFGHGGAGTGGSHDPGVPEKIVDVSGTEAIVSADTSMATLTTTVLAAPTRAVADAVMSLATQPPAQATTTAGVAPARTMVLQLSPGTLGTVSVRLHLTGHTLDVSLTASNADTASLLDHDRVALISALGDRDYQLNSLVIQGSDATSTPGGSSASTDSSGNKPASQSTADQGGGTSRGGARDSSPRQNGSDRGAARAVSAVARGDSLFV